MEFDNQKDEGLNKLGYFELESDNRMFRNSNYSSDEILVKRNKLLIPIIAII